MQNTGQKTGHKCPDELERGNVERRNGGRRAPVEQQGTQAEPQNAGQQAQDRGEARCAAQRLRGGHGRGEGPERLLGDERALRVRLAADGLRQAQPLGVDGEGDAADGQLIACREQLRRDEEVPRGEDDGVAGIGQQGAQPGAVEALGLYFTAKIPASSPLTDT